MKEAVIVIITLLVLFVGVAFGHVVGYEEGKASATPRLCQECPPCERCEPVKDLK